MTPLLLLALTAAQAPPPPAEGETTVEVARIPPSVVDDDLIRRIGVPREEDRTRAQIVGGWALVEGQAVLFSALAARWPEGAGWTLVAISPLTFGNPQRGASMGQTAGIAAGVAGIGLYNALELRGGRYSEGQRFWRNIAAWNVLYLGAEISGHLIQRQRDAARPSVEIGVGPGGAAIMLSGRF